MICTGFLCPSNYPSSYDLYSVESDIKPQINTLKDHDKAFSWINVSVDSSLLTKKHNALSFRCIHLELCGAFGMYLSLVVGQLQKLLSIKLFWNKSLSLFIFQIKVQINKVSLRFLISTNVVGFALWQFHANFTEVLHI